MNKKQVISLVTVGAMLLSSSVGVLAEELVVGSPESTVEVPIENPPTETELPTDDVVEKSDGTIIGSDDATITPPSTDDSIISQPVPSEEPKEDGSIVEPKVEESSQPTIPTKPTEVPEKPTVEIPKENKETPKEDKEQSTQDTSKDIQKNDDSLLKPIEDLTPEQPIISEQGHKIVGTQDSQVLVQKVDGTVQVQNAGEVGAIILYQKRSLNQ